MKRRVCLLVATICLLGILLSGCVKEVEFVYPQRGTGEGFSEEQYIEECHISDKLCKKMTSEQLVDAVVDYPCAIVILNTPYLAQELFREYCDAFTELEQRRESVDLIPERLKILNEKKYQCESTEERDAIERSILYLELAEAIPMNYKFSCSCSEDGKYVEMKYSSSDQETKANGCIIERTIYLEERENGSWKEVQKITLKNDADISDGQGSIEIPLSERNMFDHGKEYRFVFRISGMGHKTKFIHYCSTMIN